MTLATRQLAALDASPLPTRCLQRRALAGPRPLPLQSRAIPHPSDPAELAAERTAEFLLRSAPVPGPTAPASGRARPPLPDLAGLPPIVGETLRSGGSPLDAATRAEFEPRLGQDLGHVRLHTGERAAASADAVSAHGYTVGADIVLGSTADRRTLAHELAHVADAAAAAPRIWRQTLIGPSAAAPPERPTRLRELDVQVTSLMNRSLATRADVDALPPSSSPARTALESSLTTIRAELLGLLPEHIALMRAHLGRVEALATANPVSDPSRPHLEAIGWELVGLQQALDAESRVLRALESLAARAEIESIEQRLLAIDREMVNLPPLHPAAPASEIDDPRVKRLDEEKDALEHRRRATAARVTGSTTRYRQADPNWGSKRYGASASCTNVAEAGCGPTSLAIVLNHLFHEDPERAATDTFEIVTPAVAADYAATHGRVCNNGTSGQTMVTSVHTAWPGFQGQSTTLEGATSALRSGHNIIFLCRNCSGTNASGNAATYAGHFMVLTGVDDAARTFNVIDPAGHNLVSIDRRELQQHAAGFWLVTRKPGLQP